MKHFPKAIMKRQQLRNKAEKTRNVTDGSHYKKQRNYVVKLYNQSKKDHFDRVNAKKESKPFWKSCKLYFSNKHFFGESKIAASENSEFLTESNKIGKTFNLFFETFTNSLNLFCWSSIMLVMIKFRESYSIFQVTLVFLKLRKSVKLTKMFFSACF